MMTLRLLWLDFVSLWNRLRHDWVRELVAIICGAVLVGVFSYIMQDLLGNKVFHMSPSMATTLAQYATGLVTVAVAAATTIGLCKKFSNSMTSANVMNLATFALRLGTHPKDTRRYAALSWILSTMGSLALLLGLIEVSLGNLLDPFHLLRVVGIFALVQTVIALVLRRPLRQKSKAMAPWDLEKATTFRSMLSLRTIQLFRRNPATKLVFVGALAIICTHCYIFITAYTPFFSAIIAIIASTTISAPLALQLKEDLSYAWSERLMGLSHNQIIKIYVTLGAMIATVFGLLSMLPYLIHSYWIIDSSNIGPSIAIPIALMTAIGPLMLPSLMFQIEPRKPQITIIAVFLCELFLATLVLAYPISFIIVGLIAYYAHDYQKGRYYRA